MLVVPCLPPVAREGDDVDSVAVALKQMYDRYAHCATVHIELIKWLNEGLK